MLDQRWRSMLPLFAALFIDIFSFGLMYPVIVSLFHDPIIEDVYPPAVRNLYMSLAFSLFPLGMCFGASLLGDLSDGLGRRRTLMLCMIGLTGAYLLMWLGIETRQLLWFLVGRVLSGLMAGTSPIAQAAMMDQSAPAERGRALSNVVLVNCVGLVAGPTIGGVLGHVDFRAPLIFALLLCLAALLWLSRARIAEAKTKRQLHLSWRRPIDVFVQAFRHPVIGSLVLSFLLFQLGFGLYYVYSLINMENNYGFTPLAVGLFSATMGAGFVLGTTIGYRVATAWLGGDRRVSFLALSLCGAGILVAAAPLPVAAQWLLAFLVAASNVPAFVGLLALVSAAAGPEEQGWALGVGGAMTALAFFLAGVAAALLAFVPVWVLLVAGGLTVLAGLLPLSRKVTSPAALPLSTD